MMLAPVSRRRFFRRGRKTGPSAGELARESAPDVPENHCVPVVTSSIPRCSRESSGRTIEDHPHKDHPEEYSHRSNPGTCGGRGAHPAARRVLRALLRILRSRGLLEGSLAGGLLFERCRRARPALGVSEKLGLGLISARYASVISRRALAESA